MMIRQWYCATSKNCSLRVQTEVFVDEMNRISGIALKFSIIPVSIPKEKW